MLHSNAYLLVVEKLLPVDAQPLSHGLDVGTAVLTRVLAQYHSQHLSLCCAGVHLGTVPDHG